MKEYIVVLKSDPIGYWYFIDAPSKRIARWCALSVHQSMYDGPDLTPHDFKAYPLNWKSINDISQVKE